MSIIKIDNRREDGIRRHMDRLMLAIGLHDASHILRSRDPWSHNNGTTVNKTDEDHYDKPNQDNKRPHKHVYRQVRRHWKLRRYIPHCNRSDDTTSGTRP